MNIKVIPICDNLSYVIHDKNIAVVIDPSKGEIIDDYLKKNNLCLKSILNTHHHYDHNAGNNYLKTVYNAEVISGDDSRVNLKDKVVNDGDLLDYGFMQIKVFATPGHTSCSLSFLAVDNDTQEASIFTGDTLFVGGCGRVEEDNYENMWKSIQLLSRLPGETQFYGGHEYALDNYEFAIKMFPDIGDFRLRLEELRVAFENFGYTVPSTIAKEKQHNIFMLCSDARIKADLKMSDKSALEVFKYLRQKKNIFG